MLKRVSVLIVPSVLVMGVACGTSSTGEGSPDGGSLNNASSSGGSSSSSSSSSGGSSSGQPGDPCATNNGGCSADAVCAGSTGAAVCTCKPGYSGDGKTCADIDECATNNGGCGANATCANTKGGRTCTCNTGYGGDAGACTDIDECAAANGGCDLNATCTNTSGSRTCACNAGYAGSGTACALTTLTIATDTNLSVTNTGTRTCADGGDMVAYSVTALAAKSATLAAAPSAGCLAAGDEVLVINLQGTSTASANTGNYELLKVASVTGTTVAFVAAKTKFFGDGATDDTNLGTADTNQRVVLQRVPRYGNVVVDAGVTLTADAWDGTKGGVFAFSAAGALTLNGSISMDGKGYRGGAVNEVVNTTGQQGESIDGVGLLATQTSTAGRGGGGRGDNTGCDSYGVAGGGGGHGTAGGNAEYANCGGIGGATYGDANLTALFLGSGGGAGGTDNVLNDNPHGGVGGRGGGIVFVRATGAATGTLSSAGTAGEGDAMGVNCASGDTTQCWDFSGPGGGGAGGSILLTAASFAGGTAVVTGGAGGNGWSGAARDGGSGGEGRAKTP